MDAKRQHMTGSTMNDVIIIKIVYHILQSTRVVMHLLDAHENRERGGAWMEVCGEVVRWSRCIDCLNQHLSSCILVRSLS